jgi:hypothetical protein
MSGAADEGRRQIPQASLSADAPGLSAMLGSWTASVDKLAAAFASSGAVPHVVIDGFFAEAFARELATAFPAPADDLWHVYDNPLERKRACSDTSRMPGCLREAVCALCAPSVVELVRAITGVATADALQADPYCHGGGLHSHGAGDSLDLHLDYSRHPVSGLERRFNLIVYLPSRWDEAYGGALELRGAAPGSDGLLPGELCASVLPAFKCVHNP